MGSFSRGCAAPCSGDEGREGKRKSSCRKITDRIGGLIDRDEVDILTPSIITEMIKEKPQLSQIMGTLIQRLSLRRSILRLISPRWIKENFDDARLEQLAAPLPLAKP